MPRKICKNCKAYMRVCDNAGNCKEGVDNYKHIPDVMVHTTDSCKKFE